MKYTLLYIILGIALQTWAQSDNEIPKYRIVFPEVSLQKPDTAKEVKATDKKPSKLDFSLSKDAQVLHIIDTIRTNNKKIKKAKGYRVSVYSGPDKEEIRRIKEYVYSYYPDINIISEYKQPDYKIKVGDFLSRFEAFEVLGKITIQYPNALIVPEVVDINPPKVDD
ncbi:MAG TPA: hypothetical protein VL947_12195 [Cytophagales bacterium]|nr:hypothetical protein [Cytophagales bacterium]